MAGDLSVVNGWPEEVRARGGDGSTIRRLPPCQFPPIGAAATCFFPPRMFCHQVQLQRWPAMVLAGGWGLQPSHCGR
ncbi:hypothetical protein V6N11_047346 [Hibiscus sabdariffa]|uniref:Uncharacterized protein n=2 Tax=Hibiscus sabdariffa TaxID=183260 RepID=A0ABR2PBP0_9ROSI